MSDQEPEIPGKSSGVGVYVAGIGVMAVAIVALLVWRSKSTPTQPQIVTATATVTAAAPPPPQFAPPPPPKIETEPEPTASATSSASPSGKGVAGAGGPNPCGKCGEGESSSALTSAVQGAAASARSCYQRALQKGEVSGRMGVSVQVGSNGQVCGASITSDTVGSPQVSSCVLGRFQGRSFPPPNKGCVVVNVPINFTIQQ